MAKIKCRIASWPNDHIVSPAKPVYQILTDVFFFSPSILQRGGKLQVNVLRVFPGEEWALHKALTGGVKSPNIVEKLQLFRVQRIHLNVLLVSRVLKNKHNLIYFDEI